ncbi:MAG: hypothetical protein ABL929_11240 [Ferruginibacter sp.]|nr:hypothetical protein [Ferruginibacter sp.]
MTPLAPILFIIFNRPSSTKIVFEAIRKAKPSKLYIAADAPRKNKEDKKKCFDAKKYTENIDWPCQVFRLYQSDNLGCSLGPRAAFDWFFSQEQEGIILEDDCVPDGSFFCFATAMLEKYRANKKIISINGSNLGYKLKNGDSYSFSRYMNMWGWATWADRANKIDYNLKYWKCVKNPLLYLHKKLSNHLFDLDINWYKYWQHKFDITVTKENITWWDWQWIFHQIENNQLSIVPSVNLVTNIGFDENATHTNEANNPSANIVSKELLTPYLHPAQIKPDVDYEENFVKWVWCYHKRLPVSFYLKQLISKKLKNN